MTERTLRSSDTRATAPGETKTANGSAISRKSPKCRDAMIPSGPATGLSGVCVYFVTISVLISVTASRCSLSAAETPVPSLTDKMRSGRRRRRCRSRRRSRSVQNPKHCRENGSAVRTHGDTRTHTRAARASYLYTTAVGNSPDWRAECAKRRLRNRSGYFPCTRDKSAAAHERSFP